MKVVACQEQSLSCQLAATTHEVADGKFVEISAWKWKCVIGASKEATRSLRSEFDVQMGTSRESFLHIIVWTWLARIHMPRM